MKIHLVFHVDLLTQYCETEAHSPNYKQLVPDIINGEPKWKVEKIIKSQLHGQHHNPQFLVGWKGFPSSEDFWVPESDLSAPDLVKDFYDAHPNAPHALLKALRCCLLRGGWFPLFPIMICNPTPHHTNTLNNYNPTFLDYKLNYIVCLLHLLNYHNIIIYMNCITAVKDEAVHYFYF